MAYDPKGKSNRELNEARLNIVSQARKHLEENESNWTKEAEEKYNSMLADASDIKAIVDRRNALSTVESRREEESQRISESDLSGRSSQPAKQTVMIRAGLDVKGRPVYKAIEAGKRGTKEYQAALEQALSGNKLSPDQMASLQSDDEESAGFLLTSEQLAADILKDVDDLLYIRQYARIHTVREAGSLGIRKRTARMNTFAFSSELTISPEDNALKYGKKVLTPHHLTGMIKLSRDLVRRSMNTATSEVQYEMSRDAGEEMEDKYLLGNGSQQPLGVFTASSDGISTGRDVNTGSGTSITADGLIDAKYSLKKQYRTGLRGALRWLFHRDGIKIVSKLKDSQNNYLWLPGLREDEPDRLLGYPVDESERVPNTFTSGNYVGLLANWNYYEIADALDMEIQILNELYAGTNQIGYIGRMKTDGMPTIEEAFARLKCD
jgi:HK97 family phage major capsid protein